MLFDYSMDYSKYLTIASIIPAKTNRFQHKNQQNKSSLDVLNSVQLLYRGNFVHFPNQLVLKQAKSSFFFFVCLLKLTASNSSLENIDKFLCGHRTYFNLKSITTRDILHEKKNDRFFFVLFLFYSSFSKTNHV